MVNFLKIILVADGLADSSDAIVQALSQARNSSARLSVAILAPTLAGPFKERQGVMEESLLQGVKSSVFDAATSMNVDADRVQFSVLSGGRPAMQIIRYALREGSDLVLKQAEPIPESRGFAAVDMELLRKCPMPVWLSRPIVDHRAEMRVAVAVEPDALDASGRELAQRLLRVAAALAKECSGRLDVLSCWDMPHELYMRDNPWFLMHSSSVDDAILAAQNDHWTKLSALLSAMPGAVPFNVLHIRGKPEAVIPDQVQTLGIDILVMGTVARTGIPGLLIGNTAENVLQRLTCSLVALKPSGFVSPISAY
jgi:nucleotide-binding universal stress UspA family protein